MRTSVPKANDKDKRFFRTGPPNQKGYRFRAELPTISKDKDASSPHIKGKGVLPSTRDNGDHPHNKKRKLSQNFKNIVSIQVIINMPLQPCQMLAGRMWCLERNIHTSQDGRPRVTSHDRSIRLDVRPNFVQQDKQPLWPPRSRPVCFQVVNGGQIRNRRLSVPFLQPDRSGPVSKTSTTGTN